MCVHSVESFEVLSEGQTCHVMQCWCHAFPKTYKHTLLLYVINMKYYSLLHYIIRIRHLCFRSKTITFKRLSQQVLSTIRCFRKILFPGFLNDLLELIYKKSLWKCLAFETGSVVPQTTLFNYTIENPLYLNVFPWKRTLKTNFSYNS